MKSFELKPISPTPENARRVIELAQADLAQARGVYDETTLYHSLHIEPVRLQQEKLQAHNERYLGVYATDRLVAFAKVNEWRALDQAPFARAKLSSTALKASARLTGGHLLQHPFRPVDGIHALIADMQLGSRHDEALAELVGEITENSDARLHELRIGVPLDDPVTPVLQQYEFMPTGRFSDQVPGAEGITQELYRRPARRMK
ncbi:MAG: hypothetical protein JWN33_382 [Candidatus Saccharibacteria bacterium]|nr:hypothetical protein [Candidatus Saccharibacteria bacterium]